MATDPPKEGKIGASGDFGDWKQDKDDLKVTLKASGKVIKLKIDDATELEIKKESLQIVIPKQLPGSKSSESGPESQKTTDNPQAQTNDESKKSDGKDGGSSGEVKTNEQKENETMLGNVMNKLITYKGIVITAFIAISLGFLLRRKFKAAGH